MEKSIPPLQPPLGYSAAYGIESGKKWERKMAKGRQKKREKKKREHSVEKCLFTAQHGKHDRITQTRGTSPNGRGAENRFTHQACTRTANRM